MPFNKLNSMVFLKAGYFIDEINDILKIKVNPEVIEKFWCDNLYFSAKGLPLVVQKDKPFPLLKVAWNIINRGEPTRASINMSDFILKKFIHDFYKGANYKAKGDIQLEISSVLYSEVDGGQLSEMLENFISITDEDLVEYDFPYRSIFNILKSTISVAQIQKCILLYLLDNTDVNELSCHFVGISQDIAEQTVKDLNSLFLALNILSADDCKLPEIHYEAKSKSGVLEIGLNCLSDGITITQFIKPQEYVYDIIHTDRHVKYKKIGRIIRIEKDDEYQENFEFATFKQKLAISFFLQNVFRKNEFRPGQEAILNRALLTKDVIGLLPTGGGKSLTYQMSALLQPGITVVIDPINSLMKDQYEKLLSNGITKTAYINSNNTKEEREYHLEKLSDGKYLFIFISPERLQIQKFREALLLCNSKKVFYSYAVIDEAHCVSEWGHDFRHSYLKLSQNLRQFCKPKSTRLPLFGLTATASFDVLADVQRELEMSDDSIITLPPKAIDREELNFNIIKVDAEIDDKLVWFGREKLLGKYKYPIIRDLLENMPNIIKQFEIEYGFLFPNDEFYGQIENRFRNAGIIFCPSKSGKLPYGALHLKYGNRDLSGLDQLPFLKIGTFFGTQDDDTVQENFINEQAKESEKNQDAFLQNETNLMIATKAFGMGIDKSNIRFTIHYSFPNSVESFYQEAGRAGRDRSPSLCTIIYHPIDNKMNLKFLAASFRGVKREKEIIDELMDEIHYEDNFHFNVFQHNLKEFAPELQSISIGKDRNGEDRYIYFNGRNEFDFTGDRWVLRNPESAISIGKMDLKRSLITYPNTTKNFDRTRAEQIFTFARNFLTQSCSDGNYIEWFKIKKENGINTLIQKDNKKDHTVKIGFTNDMISMITEKITNSGILDFDNVITRAAYKFSNDSQEFLEDLEYQYLKFHKFSLNIGLQLDKNEDLKYFLRESYYRIRNTSDTLRAIYRMSIVGIIDDYTIDYAGRYLEVRFRGKSEDEYKENFRKYLRRYLGVDTTQIWLDKVDKHKDESILKRVLYTLIDFVDQEIGKKRKNSINYMEQLCSVFSDEGEREFRDRMIRYFTSKYARSDALPKDTENGTVENAAIVKKYIEYIFNPPDGLGGQIDNAKHLRGACDNLRINMRENASIDLLTAFSFFALDAKYNPGQENEGESPLFIQSKALFRKGFKRLLQIEDWESCKQLLVFFNEKVVDINPDVRKLIEPFTNEILLNRTSFRLNLFLTNINRNE